MESGGLLPESVLGSVADFSKLFTRCHTRLLPTAGIREATPFSHPVLWLFTFSGSDRITQQQLEYFVTVHSVL